MRAALVFLLISLLTQSAAPTVDADATEQPSPSPTAQPDQSRVPPEVAAWFVEDGTEAARDLTDSEDLAVGVPRQVGAWNEAFVAGTRLDQPVVLVDEWVAPVMLRSTEPPEPVGVVHAAVDDGGTGAQLVAVTEDLELAAALHRATGGVVFVHAESVEGWFGIMDGEVWPVTEGARTVLQGALAVEVFQQFLPAWLGEPVTTPPPVSAEPDDGSVSPLIPIGIIVVLGATAAWLLLRQYRQADSRIAADVRAAVEPPPEETEGPVEPTERG